MSDYRFSGCFVSVVEKQNLENSEQSFSQRNKKKVFKKLALLDGAIIILYFIDNEKLF